MNKKIVIAIVILVILIVLLLGGFAFAYFFTDAFKSNKEQFLSYLAKNGEVIEVFQDDSLDNYIQKKSNTPYTSQGEIKVSDISTDDISVETKEGKALLNTSITFTGNTDSANNYKYNNIKFNYPDTDSLSFEYLNMQDYYGIKINDVVNNYVAIENNNLKDFFTKMGVDESTVSSIPNKIDLSQFTNTQLFTEQEIKTLKDKYLNIIVNNLTDEMFTKGDKVYTLTLTYSQVNDILYSILENAQNDELIMSKIKQLMVEGGITEEEATQYVTNLQTYLQQYVQQRNPIFPSDNGESNVVINVYVENKKLSKTEIIIGNENKAIITNKTNGFTIELVINNESKGTLTLEKNKADDSVGYNMNLSTTNGITLTSNISISGLSTAEQVMESSDFSIGAGNDILSYHYTNTNTFGNIIQESVEVNDMQMLNTAPNAEAIENYLQLIGNRLIEVHNAKWQAMLENIETQTNTDTGTNAGTQTNPETETNTGIQTNPETEANDGTESNNANQDATNTVENGVLQRTNETVARQQLGIAEDKCVTITSEVVESYYQENYINTSNSGETNFDSNELNKKIADAILADTEIASYGVTVTANSTEPAESIELTLTYSDGTSVIATVANGKTSFGTVNVANGTGGDIFDNNLGPAEEQSLQSQNEVNLSAITSVIQEQPIIAYVGGLLPIASLEIAEGDQAVKVGTAAATGIGAITVALGMQVYNSANDVLNTDVGNGELAY